MNAPWACCEIHGHIRENSGLICPRDSREYVGLPSVQVRTCLLDCPKSKMPHFLLQRKMQGHSPSQPETAFLHDRVGGWPVCCEGLSAASDKNLLKLLSSGFPSVKSRTRDFRSSLVVVTIVPTFLDLLNNFYFLVCNWHGQYFFADIVYIYSSE